MSEYDANRRMRSVQVLFAALSLGIASLGLAQPVGPQKVSVEDLQADFVIFERLLKELHPGLYRYNTPAQLESNLSNLKAYWMQPRTTRDVFTSMSEFLATLKCGHTYTNFYNQSNSVKEVVYHNTPKLPFHFKWIGGKMVVTQDFSESDPMPAGTLVHNINGTSTSTIFDTLLKIARADGSNVAKRTAYLEVGGGDPYPAFDVYFPLYFPGRQDGFSLTVKIPDKVKPQSRFVKAITYSERESQGGGWKKPADPQAPWWEMRKISPDIALLKMDSWAMFNTKWDWRTFLNTEVDKLIDAKVGNLIVDVRTNEGGYSCGDVLLSRFTEKPIPLEPTQNLAKFDKVPADLRGYLDTWDDSFYDWTKRIVAKEDGMYRIRPNFGEAVTTIKPSGRTYRGKVYVLVGPVNSSATFLFASIIKQAKLGTLVGKPTGGNQRGINGSGFFFAKLPKSGIEFDIPILAQSPIAPKPDAGINPDVYVQTIVDDIAEGRDPEMDVVLTMIKYGHPTKRGPENPLTDW